VSVDLSDKAAATAKRVNFYYGSPRALLCLDGDVEGDQRLIRIPSCHLLCAIQTHKHLLKVAHLFPENCFVGQRDVVPGVVTGTHKNPKSGAVDNFYQPKLAPKVPCSIERIVIRLGSSVEKFEKELCTMVLNEYNKRCGTTSGGGSAQVNKRYLRVGVHNGLTYVDVPEEVQLSLSSDSLNSNRTGSLRPGHQRSSSTGSVKLSAATSLAHRGRIDVEGLLQDVMLHIVFTLVYDITLPAAGGDDSAAKRVLGQPVLSCAIRWAALSPFASDAHTHKLTLIGGSSANPDLRFIFGGGKEPADKSKTSQLADTITLRLNLGSLDAGDNAEINGTYAKDGRLSESNASLNSEDSNVLVHSASKSSKQHVISQKPPRHAATGHHDYANAELRDGHGYPPIQAQYQDAQLRAATVSGAPPHYASFSQYLTSPPGQENLPPIMASPPPIIASIPGTRRGPGLTRAGYARLHAAGFPPILDRNGKAADVLDQSDMVRFDPNSEDRDRLKVNEIILQFMAFSRVASSGTYNTIRPQTIFFSFQFYNFDHVTSERLILSCLESDLSADANSLPFILQRLDRDGSVLKGPPGYQVRYEVDPAHLKSGEARLFIKYLAEQSLHIDVWDGDSLVLIGSCVADLKHLCRQGRDAVQVTHELDIFLTDSLDEVSGGGPLSGGNLTRDGATYPVNLRPIVTGRLHLRLGNVGRMSELKLSQLKTFIQETSKKLVVAADTAQPSTQPLSKTTRICKAQHLADVSQELAMLINNRRQKTAITGNEENQFNDSSAEHRLPAEKMKKLARMEKIRQIEGTPDTAPLVTIHRAKEERSRDLRTIELFRTHCKRDGIMNMLNVAITTEHMLFVSMGTAEFFEFVLHNPYNVEHMVQIDWEDNDLFVITDTREWRYFKMLNNVTTPVEEKLFSSSSGADNRPQIFLRPKESVNVPFKFLTFHADHSIQDEMPSDPYRPFSQAASFLSRANKDHLESRHVKVVFRTAEMKQIAILSLRVEMRPHIINQTFRLNHPEHSFLDRPIRLPPLQSLMEMPSSGMPVSQVFVRCSDPSVICRTVPVQPGDPHDVFLKVAVGAAPQIKRFFVVSYVDPAMSRPLQIWQFYIHAMQRIDVGGIVGQTSRTTIVLRGTQSSRLIKCFSSHPSELQVEPCDPFMLPAQGLQELYVGVRPLAPGSRIVYINAVDIELHQVVRSWLICVSAKMPMPKKTFELQLPVGGGQGHNKRITFVNPYRVARTFDVMCNRPELLRIKDVKLELGPNEAAKIGMVLVPAQAPNSAEIFVFINDDQGRTEETFAIRAVYV
jgi:nephrocystin-4